MLAREIMTSPAVTAKPQLSIIAAIRLLDHHDITAVPVVDDRDRLVGVISEADLLPGRLQSDPRSRMQSLPSQDVDRAETVADVMTLGVITAQESTDAAVIASLMLETGVKSVPVVRGAKVVGIVSRRDLIHALASTDDDIRDEVRELLTEVGLGAWTVDVEDGAVRMAGARGSERDTRIAATLARTVGGVTEVLVPSPETD